MPDARSREDISNDYQAARAAQDDRAMARFQHQEACLVLLAIMERLAADPRTFIHTVAVKGGMLMAGELKSPRTSADIDFTRGRQRRIDPDRVIREVRQAGRQFNVRADAEPARTAGGEVIHLRFDSLTDAGTAKIEVSIREDLVFAVRDALFDVTDIGLSPFSVPALAEVELVSEKIRALVQRAQPRDLFDLRLYLVDAGWHLDPVDLLTATNAKLSETRHKRWRAGLWRNHVDDIEPIWTATLEEWIEPAHIPAFKDTLRVVDRRLRELRLD